MGEDMHNIQPTSLNNEELLRFSEDMLRQDLPLPRSWALELVKRFDSEYERGHEDALDVTKPTYICDYCGSKK